MNAAAKASLRYLSQKAARSKLWIPLFLVSLVASSQNSFSIIGIPLLAKQNNYTPGQLSTLLGIFPLFAAFSTFVSGPISDFIGRKRTLMVGLTLLALSLCLHLLARTFLDLAILRAITGLSIGTIAGLPSILLSDHSQVNQQQSLISKSVCGYALGQTIAVPAGIVLMEHLGYLTLNALVGLSVVAIAVLAYKQIPHQHPTHDRHQNSLRAYFHKSAASIKSPALSYILLSAITSFTATSLFYVLFALWLYKEASLLPTEIAPMYIAAGALQVFVLTFLLPRISHFRSSRIAITSFALTAFLLIIAPLLLKSPFAAALLFSLIIGSISLRISPIQHLVIELGPRQQKGLRMSLLQTCNLLGRALGSSIASFLFVSISQDILFPVIATLLVPSFVAYYKIGSMGQLPPEAN